MLIFSSICNVFFLILLRLTASTTTINIVLRPRHDESPIDDLSCKLSPDKMMKIILKPKALNETHSTNFFQCGVDASIDEEKMVAEWNNQAIFNFLKSKDNDPEYQTKVHAVIKWDNSGQPVMGMKEEDEDGVYSLFVAPHSDKCDTQTLDRAVNMEEGFYPVFIGASNNFSDPQNKFLNEIKCLEKNYGEDKPSLCSTKLAMNHLTATSRIRTIQSIYNFAYNNGRNVNLNKIKQCKSETETKEAIATMSNIFYIKPDCHFKETNQTVLESEGFAKVTIVRKTSDRKLIIMVKTIFKSDNGSANESDLVNFDNFVVFDKNEKYSEVYITIKEDNVEESNEKFNLIIQPFIERRRKKRSETSEIIDLEDKPEIEDDKPKVEDDKTLEITILDITYPTTEEKATELMLKIKTDDDTAGKIYKVFETEHDKLTVDGYIFLGWRAIKPFKYWKKKPKPDEEMQEEKSRAHKINVEDYLNHNKDIAIEDTDIAGSFYSEALDGWQGVYLATFVGVCYGYVEETNDRRMDDPATYLPWVFRVYLKNTDIEHVATVKKWTEFRKDGTPILDPNPYDIHPALSDEYIYYGKEGEGEDFKDRGFEMVLSPSVAQKARFLLSTFTAKGYTVVKKLKMIDQDSTEKEVKKNKGELYETKYGDGDGDDKTNVLNADNKFI